MKYFLFAIVLLLSACSFTPQQEALLYQLGHDNAPVTITAQELRNILPPWAEVKDGDYLLVPRGLVKTVHDAPYCMAGSSPVLVPKTWDCKDYAYSLDAVMGDVYAFGTAVSLPHNGHDGHMVNIFVDTDKNIVLYDPGSCQFVRMEVNEVSI